MSLKICIPAIAAFLLAACGGDDNNASDPAPSAEADFVVDTFGDLSVCTGNREGATAYVKDEEKDYICTDGDWAIDIDADTRKKSSSSKDKAKSSSSRCEDCKDEANSNSNFAGQKTAWEYLSPNIDYGEMVDDRDGQIYKTVKIGGRMWMAENLNYETANSWCGGGNGENEGDCSKYGRLYTWAAAVGKSEEECGYDNVCRLSGTVRGVCPEGWHLPDTTEWRQLFASVGGNSVDDDVLKSQTGWNNDVIEYDAEKLAESRLDWDGNGSGTDNYGFSALPAGYRGADNSFSAEGYNACFWSTTGLGQERFVYFMRLSYLIKKVDQYYFISDPDDPDPVRGLKDNMLRYWNLPYASNKNDAYSVRCLQDKYGELVDSRDGQTYKTLKIGEQVWMAENLNYEVDSSFCYKDSAKYCEKYGRLYQWAASVGACPEGWHLPDTTEWNILFTTVGGKSIAGKILKSWTGWDSCWDNRKHIYVDGNGSDFYGFFALPAGSRSSDGISTYGFTTNFWSSTEYKSDEQAYDMFLSSQFEDVRLNDDDEYNAYSVRCLKD